MFFTSDFSFLKPLFPQEAQLRIIMLLSECTHTDPFLLLQSRKKLMERARIEPGFSFSSSDSSNLRPNTLSAFIRRLLLQMSMFSPFPIFFSWSQSWAFSFNPFTFVFFSHLQSPKSATYEIFRVDFVRQKAIIWAIGCGSVWRAVASKSRGPWFKSSHWQKFILNIYCQLYWKDDNKEKEAGNGPFF